jgi:hypothetical protein
LVVVYRALTCLGWENEGAGSRSRGSVRTKGCGYMRFIFEVDMNTEAMKLNPEAELGRVLRYWAGNLKNYPMEPGTGEEIVDSEYKDAGSWAIVGD